MIEVMTCVCMVKFSYFQLFGKLCCEFGYVVSFNSFSSNGN